MTCLPMIDSRRGRAQRTQSSMSSQQNAAQTKPSTIPADFVRPDHSGVVQAITAKLVGIWPKGSQPRNPAVASQRAQVMTGKAQPIKAAWTLVVGAMAEGKSWEDATQWATDLIAAAEAEFARRERRQSPRVIPIHEAHDRMLVAAIREDAEADCREATVKLDSIDSLEAARAERLDAIEKDQRKVEFYTARIAELRALQAVGA
jgi:hypothetical protein